MHWVAEPVWGRREHIHTSMTGWDVHVSALMPSPNAVSDHLFYKQTTCHLSLVSLFLCPQDFLPKSHWFDSASWQVLAAQCSSTHALGSSHSSAAICWHYGSGFTFTLWISSLSKWYWMDKRDSLLFHFQFFQGLQVQKCLLKHSLGYHSCRGQMST